MPQSAAVLHYVDPCVNKVAGVGVAQRMKGYPPDPGLTGYGYPFLGECVWRLWGSINVRED